MLAHATVDGVAVPPSLLPTYSLLCWPQLLTGIRAWRLPYGSLPTPATDRQGWEAMLPTKKSCLEIGSQLRNVARLKQCASLNKRF